MRQRQSLGVFWAYNTNFTASGTSSGATGIAFETSPVLFGDGSKVGFVESRTNGNGGSILHLLKWKQGDGTAINSFGCPHHRHYLDGRRSRQSLSGNRRVPDQHQPESGPSSDVLFATSAAIPTT